MKARESIEKAVDFFLNIKVVNDEWSHAIYLNCDCNRVDRFHFHHSRTMRTRRASMRPVRQPSTSRPRRRPRFSGTI
ncbi:hypothetical protein [Burkholderia diffusa]|uniref:hypothetical protein n=1 Tax=Burkholderia diffusa TaxID=488732 RepID=UPI000AF2B59C|nr:hypothetical protein [Burkholderia diffusa]